MRMLSVETMKYQCNLGKNLLILMVTMALSQTVVLAQTTVEETSSNDISPKKLTIDPIKNQEILSSDRGTANTLSELLAPPIFQNKITRNITWTKRIQLDKLQFPLSLTYEFKSSSGQSNKFIGSSNSKSSISVVLKELQSTLVFRSEARNLAIIEGSVELTLDPSKAKSGEHAGQLFVCIKSLDGSCL
jgi:hypothetical protein